MFKTQLKSTVNTLSVADKRMITARDVCESRKVNGFPNIWKKLAHAQVGYYQAVF